MKFILVLLVFSTVLALPYGTNDNQIVLGSDEWSRRLISVAEGHEEWMSMDQIFDLYKEGIRFIDVTNEWHQLDALVAPSASAIPAKPAHEKLVRFLNSKIDVTGMKTFLTAFSGFHTRYFKSNAGTLSAAWLYHQCKTIVDEADSSKVNMSIREFEHSWKQPSIIVRIERANNAAANKKKDKYRQEIVVISAHQDSINAWNPLHGRAPGADDDGSGTTTIFETLRLLVRENFVPTKAIEFHFYSAEEGGLLGSQAVVAAYKKAGTAIMGVYHVDMTGYPAKKPSIGLSTDFVDGGMSGFVKMLVETYCDVPVVHTKCGYACSDHASWTKAGYRAAFTFEGPFDAHSPYIHTTKDDISTVSFTHMAQFVRVAIAFAVELSHSNKE
ncbi:hypothetical protein SeLEV6574_g03613 [Synchytrium endobioticum]|uniref:Peptide hydrolase n=1 Tax=Synchytrium endobioticum TaxID=286115 RepID=A0A507D3L8_9FUNG|nr:hypothetical protein SeLEV6574_g03613 [Synchytrium endobioticum]